MKVLLLANHVNYGGITAYLLNLARALNRRDGFEYVVASRGGELEDEFRVLGIEHLSAPLSTKCEVSLKVFLSFLKLRRLIGSRKIDVIHANTRVTQVLASLLSSATGVPFISTCHGYFKPKLIRRLLPCWGKKVIAISDPVRDHLINDFGVKGSDIELVYNGIDLEKFKVFDRQDIEEEKKRLGLDLSKKVIGHIGRLSSVKGQKFLVLAASVLAQKRNDLQFLIIGDGEESAALKELVRQRGLGSVVFLRPSVADTARVLAVMDIFAMPSLQEGLGLSALEAQAARVPVVASRVGGLVSVVEHEKTGLLFDSGDYNGLAGAVERLLNDGALAKNLISNARRGLQEKFTISLMAQKTLKVYKEVACLRP